MPIKQQVIFWDWNGTLLDDAVSCVAAMNTLLKRRNRPAINLAYYKSIFGFPVLDYYQKLGFDFSKESFEELSHEFIFHYKEHIHLANLQSYSLDVLENFRQLGKKQIVISAMEQQMLEEQLRNYGVLEYFDDFRGITDIFANGKVHLAHNYIAQNSLNQSEILFIGDTLHDQEVADQVNISSVLISDGHQTAERLRVNGNKVINNLKSLLELSESF